MENTIAKRVAQFIGRFAPFDLIENEQLLAIAEQVRIQYLQTGECLFQRNDALHNHFYIVHRGAIALEDHANNQEEIIDYFDEGDVFGLRPLFAKENYLFNSVAREESIVYAIPLESFRPIAENNREVGVYLMESFASNSENPYSKEHQKKFFANESFQVDAGNDVFELQPVNYNKKVISAQPDTPIRQAALMMKKKKVGSVVIVEDDIPVGIITNKDLRNRVATGEVSVEQPVKKIMSSPVLCYPADTTLAQAHTTMMKHNVNHLVITEDGTPNTRVIGLVSDNEIVVMQANNPAAFMKAIQRSQSTKELKHIRMKIMQMLESYIMNNLPLMHTSRIIFELNDATIKQIIERSLQKMKKQPPVSFAWMSLGSQGRKEQLLQTDQDNAIIFENVPDEELEETRTYFLQLAKKINKRLEIVGFSFCNAEMMARNPRWCLSLDEWKQQFTDWTTETGNDELLLSSIFFDFDISYGHVSLTNALSDHVFHLTENNQLFMAKLAASAIRSPSPLGFFRQFLVEKDGKHKDQFDLKTRALMPLIDGGRVLGLSYQIKNTNNTFERFQRVAELYPERAELFEACSYAFKALMKFRTKHGLLNNDNGRYIQLEEMSKEEKMKLKRSFKTISSLQEFIKVHYSVSNLV